MVETLDQKVGAYVVDALLSNPSGIPSIRGATGRTGTLEHVVSHSAANAGWPKQEQSCMATEAQYYSTYDCNGLCRPLWGTDMGIRAGN